ncbi:EamA family transporter [Halobaculum sp. P14]|uniref:EamA family transporter n=1 Tax=Halobaculum sp. P14 TaxID=3421638 RepID=UPI003EB7B0B4
MTLPLDFGLAAAVAAAVLWGGYLFSLKYSFSAYPASVLVVLVDVAALAWYAPVAAATVDVAALPSPAQIGWSGAAALAAIVGGVAAGYVLFIEALDGGDVSYVAPINKVVPVFVLPLEVVLLDETIPPLAVAGVVVVTAAVYVANYRGGDLAAPLRRAATSTPARLALLSAMAYAVGDVAKRAVVSDVGLPPQALVLTSLVGVPLVLLPLAVRSWPDGPLEYRTFAAAGLVVAAAEHLTAVAFAAVPASIASPIVNTQAVVAVILGGVVLGEKHLGIRLAAAALAVVGVTMLAI